MSRTVVLDATPLGFLCHPNPRGEALLCQRWAEALNRSGSRMIIPEVVDYEVRRELLRARRTKAIALLDRLRTQYVFVPVNSTAMHLAAELWAQVRQLGLPTAGPESLDADAIVAAQALSLNDPNIVVATSNPVHIRRFVQSEMWHNIPTS